MLLLLLLLLTLPPAKLRGARGVVRRVALHASRGFTRHRDASGHRLRPWPPAAHAASRPHAPCRWKA